MSAFKPEESGYIKFNILKYYILGQSDIMDKDLFSFELGGFHQLLFGGVHGYNFDTEIGCWIGAVGIMGFLGLIMLLSKIVKIEKLTFPFITALIFLSIGNTVFMD